MTKESRRRNETGQRPKTNWPSIVESSPEIGATDVDPDIDGDFA